MSRPIIEVENVSKRYKLGQFNALTLREEAERLLWRLRGKRANGGGADATEFWALSDVSFSVQPGEVLGIIGRNGAGKSTLLRILSRITEPTCGEVRIRGRVASLLEVGTGFHPELTGRENIYLNGAILGMSRAEIRHKFDEIVAFADIEKFLDTPVKRYSSGMYVRLAFAVGAHLEPEILIIDEVLAVGDSDFQTKCLTKMGDLACREGRTVLFVSHNLPAIRALCPSAILFESGRIAADGCAADVLHRYIAGIRPSAKSVWRRQSIDAIEKVGFESLSVRLTGEQPAQRLLCEAVIQGRDAFGSAFMAVDVSDDSSTVLMQAIPPGKIGPVNAPGISLVTVEIELPPMIPGVYGVDFWIGPHFSETYDSIRGELSIEITQGPIPGRTYPYTRDHGAIVPHARIVQLTGAI